MFIKFLKDESGATAIEYGLLAALIGLAVAGGASLIGGNLTAVFSTIADKLSVTAPAAG